MCSSNVRDEAQRTDGPAPLQDGLDHLSGHEPDPVEHQPEDEQQPRLRLASLAEEFLSQTAYSGRQTLHVWKGQYWSWSPEDPRYVPVKFQEFSDRLLNWLIATGKTDSPDTSEDLAKVLRAKTRLPPDIPMPAWLGGVSQPSTMWIAMKNFLVNPMNLASGTYGILRHTPCYFSSALVPYDYLPNATCPKWKQWLSQMLEGDEERINLLQEFFGYWLIPDTSRQVALVLKGEGGTGKSTVIHIAQKMLGGSMNCSFVEPTKFNNRFSGTSMIGKLLNVSDELKKLTPDIESALKWYIGGSAVTVERKYADEESVLPTARLLLAFNRWPKVSDMSEGFWRRLKVIPFNVEIPEHQRNPHLGKELEAELPGILVWALEGLRRLQTNNVFTTTKLGMEELANEKARNRNHEVFLRDHLMESSEESSFVSMSHIMASYQQWCLAQGYTEQNTDRDITESMKKLFPKSAQARKQLAGTRHRGFSGVKLT